MAVTTPLWSVPAETNFGRGVVAEGLVIFGDMAGDLRAVRIADGTVAWNIRIEAGVREDLTLHGDVVFGSSLREGGPGAGCVAFAVAPRSGDILWKSTLSTWTAHGPIVRDDEVLFITDREDKSGYTAHRLNRATGEALGTAPLEGKAGVILELRGPEIIYFLRGGTDLLAKNLDTGAWTLWFRAPRKLGHMILKGEQAYVSFEESPQLSVVTCIKLSTGEAHWTQFLDCACSGLDLNGDELVVRAFAADDMGRPHRTSEETGQVLCLDADNGVVRWRFSYGTEPPGSVAFDGDGRLLVSMARRSDGPVNPWLATVFLLDLRSGKELLRSEQPARPEWITPLSPVSVVSHGDAVYGFEFGRVWRKPVGSPVRSIGINEFSILAGLSNGQLKAVSRTAGAGRWAVTLHAPIGARPVTSQGLVMVGDGQGLVALGATDGALRWRFATEKPVAAAPRLLKDKVVFGCRDEFVRAVRIADGELSWAFKTNGFVESLSVFDVDYIYVPSGDGTLYCLNAQGGLRWSYAANEILRAAPLVKLEVVVVVDAAGFIHALDLETGALAWKVQAGSSHGTHPVSAGVGALWVAEDGPLPNGTGRVFQLSDATGALLRMIDLSARVRGELARSGDRLFIPTESGDIEVLDVKSGERRRLVPLHARTQSGALLAPDGVVVGDEAGMLHLLTP